MSVFLTGCVGASLDDGLLDPSNNSQIANTQANSQVLANGETNKVSTNGAINGSIGAPTQLNALQQTNEVASANALQAQTSNNGALAPIAPSNPSSPTTTSVLSKEDKAAELARQAGVQIIREKADQSAANPSQASLAPTEGRHFTAEELRLKRALLKAEAQAANGLISQSELIQKRQQIAALRKKARTHYKQAVKQIAR
ncbi:MAG: hypothetical protein AB8B49_02255 [Nitratireductor sp.]